MVKVNRICHKVLGSKAYLLESKKTPIVLLLREVIKHPFLFDIKSPILLAERQRESETTNQMERLNASSWGAALHDDYRHICTLLSVGVNILTV